MPGPGEPGNETWKGDSWQHGGGAAWLVGSYDPKTNTVFWGTSNPGPWNAAVRSTGNGDYGKLTNLYTASTLALDADTGQIKWHLQATPEDAWDYDGVNELVLADLNIDGRRVPAMLKADRNGFFYVANRETGKLISAETYVPQNWAKSIDIATTRPVEIADKRPAPGPQGQGCLPEPDRRQELAADVVQSGHRLRVHPDQQRLHGLVGQRGQLSPRRVLSRRRVPDAGGPGGYLGEIMAWDPVAQKKVWGVKEDLPFNGGTLTTAGGLVFYGNLHGVFKALDAKTGAELWKMQLGSGIGAAPISYAVGGKQYIAVVVGRTASMPAFLGEIGNQMVAATPEGGALFVFTQ